MKNITKTILLCGAVLINPAMASQDFDTDSKLLPEIQNTASSESMNYANGLGSDASSALQIVMIKQLMMQNKQLRQIIDRLITAEISAKKSVSIEEALLQESSITNRYLERIAAKQ